MTEELDRAENKELPEQNISGYKEKSIIEKVSVKKRKTVTEDSFLHSGDLFWITMTPVTGQTKNLLLVSISFRTAAEGQI